MHIFCTHSNFRWCIFKAHWEQLKEMEALCRKEGKLLCQQPDMVRNIVTKATLYIFLMYILFFCQAFGDYVHQLEEIMEKKARCVHSMRAQLQPYLKPITSNHPQGADDHRSTSWIWVNNTYVCVPCFQWQQQLQLVTYMVIIYALLCLSKLSLMSSWTAVTWCVWCQNAWCTKGFTGETCNHMFFFHVDSNIYGIVILPLKIVFLSQIFRLAQK